MSGFGTKQFIKYSQGLSIKLSKQNFRPVLHRRKIDIFYVEVISKKGDK